MELTEAIVLAGGLGTRLREAVPGVPKCMAPVNGRPFVSYVVNHLRSQGIRRFVFSLGYRSEAFGEYLAELLPEGSFELVIENEPLGTGGAIRFAGAHTNTQQVVVVNGDSLFKTDLGEQADFHFSHDAHCTLALKPMEHADRYGAVEIHSDRSIAAFREKQFFEKGLINGGVYIVDMPQFISEALPEKFSFESDYLQRFYTQRRIYGVVNNGYFIDIGIPQDYERAQKELKTD